MEQVRLEAECASLSEALAMSHEGVEVFRSERDATRWFCVLTWDNLRIGVELIEEIPGSGDRAVVGLEVRPLEGSLTVSALRGAAYGSVIRAARAAVASVSADRKVRRLSRPNDPPPAFRGDRRGRAARSDKDYACLADSYLGMNKEARRHAAAKWAEDFPEGGSKRTWMNRLVRAKRFIEGESLTDEGMALVYGEGWLERFEFDADWDSALNIATMPPGGEIWRRLQRDGKDPRQWRAAAQHAIGVRVDEQGRAYPLIPHKLPKNVGNQDDAG